MPARASYSVLGTLLCRTALRHWRFEPRTTLLLLAILSLGVAVFVSIRLANRAAVASFTRFTDTLTGQSDWIVRAPAGPLDASVLREIRDALGATPVNIVPVVEATATPPARADDTARFGRPGYTLLGVDLIAVANLATQLDAGTGYFGQQSPASTSASATSRAAPVSPNDTSTDPDAAFWTAFASGPQIWLSPRHPTPHPTSLELVLDEQIRTLPVAGLIPTAPDAPAVPPNLLIIDLPQLQQLTGKVGRIDRIEFVLEAGPRLAERRAALRTTTLVALGAAGARWSVTSHGAERETAATMTRAFRLNLTILSLIALLVGLYLIFQALDGAVVRRRTEIAILRSLGVEERTIRRMWLLESAMLGLLGGGLGVLLGWLGAQAAVQAVGRTVNALYFTTTVQAAHLATPEIILGLALGLISSLIAGWWPALVASRTPPAQILQRGAPPTPGARVLRSTSLALAFIAAGIICALLPPWRFEGGGRFPVAGYAAAFLWIFGGGIASAWLLPRVAAALRPAGRTHASARIALSHLRLPSGRHRLAVAALHCAVGMTAGMAILVASFDSTVRTWVAQTLQADLYLSSSGAQSATSLNRLSPAAADAIAAHPAVAASSRLVAYPVRINDLDTLLSGTDLAALGDRSQIPWVDRPRTDAVFDPARNATLALVSEAFTERFGLARDAEVTVPTPTGPRRVRIAGVFADYGNERGSILLERAHVREWFADDHVTNLSLWLRDGADADTVRADLLATYPGLSVFTNAALRDEVLRIFRQTFAITYALEIIGVLVAVIGLALTLTSVLLDRRDELTTLRALGFSRRELARSTAIEGATVAGAAVGGGTILSLALGWLLIHVINQQSFGWTLTFALPWAQLAALGAVVILTGAAVSWWVGRWAADLPADREE